MADSTNYLPTREPELVTWANNLQAKISATPAKFGVDASIATAFTALHSAWNSAYQTAKDPDTNSKSNTAAKNMAKDAMINGDNGIRAIAKLVQAKPGITAEALTELGLTVRDNEPSPIPVPTVAPGLDIVSVNGRTVTVRVHDAATPTSRAKPAGVKGVGVVTFVGAEPPETIEAWKYEGSTTKNVIDIDFPLTVEPGSVVWLSAYWQNAKFQAGPPCDPLQTRIQYGLAAAA